MNEIFEYLNLLKENNNRPWFEANKSHFNLVRVMFLDFLLETKKAIEEFHPLPNWTPEKGVYRIYRDVRFSKDKTPYKNNFSALFGEDGKKTKGFINWYLQIQPGNNSFLGAGSYDTSPVDLAKIRQEIDYNSEQFLGIVQEKKLVKAFGSIQGNELKTAPKGYEKSHPLIEFIRKTQLYYGKNYSDEEVLEADFPKKVAADARLLLPFCRFLNQATQS